MSSRWTTLALVGGALAVRLATGDRWPVDYDEGVYVTSAALWRHGLWPYRDFVFLHPPGILLWLFPWTMLGPKAALGAARLLSSVVGVVNVGLVHRLLGGRGGVVAAVLLACWPEAVGTERGAFLEPVMTLCGLGALFLVTRDEVSVKSARLAGVLCGAAVVVKLWGGAWVLAVLLAVPHAHRLRLLKWAAGSFLVALSPFVVAGGAAAGEQVLLAHLHRPPDGQVGRLERLHEMFLARNPWPLVLLVLALPFLRRSPVGRGALVAASVLVLALVATPAYWNQYNAALAPFLVLIIGAGASAGLAHLRRGATAATVVLCSAAIPSAQFLYEFGKALAPRSVWAPDVGDEPLCAFETFELVLLDRLPAMTSRPVLVDSYGQMLRDAGRSGVRFESAAAAFASEAAQVTLRQQLPQCPVLRTGWRGDWQMNAATQAWVRTHFEPLGDGWWRRASPAAP